MNLSVVVPVYNEERTVSSVLDRLLVHPLVGEVVVVDDASTDGTPRVLESYRTHPKVQVLRHPVNRGKGAALRTGFARIRGDFVVVQDADLEYDPADFEGLMAPIRSGRADVVYGSRFLRGDRWREALVHTFGNRLLTLISNATTGYRLTDMETCYKLLPRSVLGKLNLTSNRFGFEPEVTARLARLGMRIVEVPIRYLSRGYDHGKKIGWKDAISAVWIMIRSRLTIDKMTKCGYQ